MSYTRRTELTCTQAELTTYADKVLLANELLAVVKTSGRRDIYYGDGTTPISGLSPSVSYDELNALKTAAETAKTGADTARTGAETARTGAETAQAGAETTLANAILKTAQTLTDAEQAQARANIGAAQANSIVVDRPTTWAEVQRIVRAGLASQVFAVGDQLTCKRGTQTLTWDILGFDQDTPANTSMTHSMTLQLHDYINAFKYDAPEALYYAAEAIPAGTYHYTLDTVGGWKIGDGVTRQFTLTTSVPKGGQIGINGDASTPTSSAMTYASKTATNPIETVSVTAGSGGTALDNLNHVHRISYGSNNWQASALRQWLNSDGAAGAWWAPASNFDRPPATIASMAGFLNGLDTDFLDVVGKVTKRTTLNAVNDGGGYVDLQERLFLLSPSEVYMTNNNNIEEGAVYDFYKMFSDLSAPGNGADSNRAKRAIGGTSASSWCLRSPYPSNTYTVYLVQPDGSLNNGSSNFSRGVAPCVSIV